MAMVSPVLETLTEPLRVVSLDLAWLAAVTPVLLSLGVQKALGDRFSCRG